jgi:phosphoglycolate phosphatase
MRRYDLLIFDFDGTLADSFPFFVEAFDTVADTHRLRRLDRSRVDELRGCELPQLMRHIGLPRWKLLPVAMQFRALMAQDIASIRLFDGVRELLRAEAARGTVLALVTSNSEPNVRAVLGDDARLFAHVECGAALFGKRRRLRRVVQASGVPPERVLGRAARFRRRRLGLCEAGNAARARTAADVRQRRRDGNPPGRPQRGMNQHWKIFVYMSIFTTKFL